MKKHFLLLFLIMFFVWGCATTQDVKNVQHGLDRKIATLQEEAAKLQKGLDENRGAEKSLRKIQADAVADLSELREEIKKLRGTLEELKRDLETVRAERKNKETKLDDLALRIGFIESFIGVGKKSEFGETEKKEEKPGNSHTGNGKNGRNGKPDGDTLYSAAYEDFKAAKYEDARNAFKKYIELYPKTDLADNAQFWIGESYYLENNYEKAILEYEKVVKNYPEGNKVPVAMLKQGMSFLKMADKASAKLLFEQVIKDYPNTNQAKIARAKLAEIK